MKSFFFIFLVGLTINGFAQKVSNALTFQKGQKLEVTTNMNRSSTQELMGQSMETTMSTTNTNVYEVNDAGDGKAALDVKVKRIKFDMNLMNRNETFDSDNAEDMKGDMGKMMKGMLDQKYTMTLNASGSVTAVKEEEDKNKKKGSGNAGMMEMMMGRMGQGGGVPKVGDASIFKILPDREVGKGDTWKTESSDEAGKKTANYTITDITDNDILIDFTEDANLTTKQQMMGQEMGVDIKSKSTGKIILDRKTGLLKQKTFLTTSEENINAGGMMIPSTGKATTTMTVKSI